ncbi:diguanylate cyclase [Niveibacterium sp.]|uniref:diguanylate cyclase n=1 Tax=Niveibacterium sp. TaxID=2017444 RepID=UPI0035B40A69
MPLPLAVFRTLLRLGLPLLAALLSANVLAGIADDINEIERAHGADSDVVISKIAGMESAARKSGGVDLRVFLAAWGYAHAMTGGRAVAEAAASELEDLGVRSKDKETLAAAYTLRANILELQGRSRIARDWVAKAMPLALQSSDLSLRYWVATTAGFSAYESGALEEALAMFQSALSAAEETKDDRRLAQTHINMVSLLLTLKDAAGAMQHAEAAFRFAQAGKQHGLAAQAKALEAVAAEALGDTERQRQATEASIALSKDVGGPAAQLGVLLNLSDLNLRAHNFGAARAQADQALTLARSLNDEPGQATAELNLGFALIGLGKIADGRRIAEHGVAYYRKIDSKSDVLATLNQYGEILERAGDAGHALKVVREAQAIEDEMLRGDRQRTVVEMQQRYEAEKRSKEIELLNRDNALKTAELGRQQMARRSSWLLAVVLALASIIAILLYGRVRRANQLLAAKNADLEFMSKHDPLTGLFNRRHFTGLLEAMPPELPHRREEDADDLVRAVFLLDIDHFKQINDNHGHRDGDAVLVEVARRLRETLRDSETVVRWGGEEFLVLAPAIRRAHLDELATRLLNTVGAAAISTYGPALRVTTSIGYSPLELPGDPSAPDWERALHRADLALFLAKRRGRNQAIGVCTFSDAEAIERNDDAALPPSIPGPAVA